jgi:crotonobetainyl-CoA:carnitine CoA-transferase CaiB-like acyl-CoA transferase
MSETTCRVQRPAPCLGEHTDDVLTRVLGYSEQRIEQLKRQGVLV